MSRARRGTRNSKKRRRDLSAEHAAVSLAEANSSASPAPTAGVEELRGGRSKRQKGTPCLEDVLEENSRLKEQAEEASNERKAILAKLEAFKFQVEDALVRLLNFSILLTSCTCCI